MKKFMNIMFWVLLIVVGLYIFNDGFREWAYKKTAHLKDTVSQKAKDLPESQEKLATEYEIEKIEKDYNETVKEINDLLQEKEDLYEVFKKTEKELMKSQSVIDTIKACFQKSGMPDPVDESFDDPKFSKMTVTIQGKTMAVLDAVNMVRNEQSECNEIEKEQAKRKADIERKENAIADLTNVKEKVIDKINEIKDQAKENGEREREGRLKVKIESLLDRTGVTDQKLKEREIELQARYETKEELRPEIAANATIDVEVKSVEEGTDVPDTQESEAAFKSLLEQMGEQMDNSAAKERSKQE